MKKIPAIFIISILIGTMQTTSLAISYISENHRPTAPYVTGPNSGKIGVEYNWTFVSTDPEENNITYYIDWADECGGAEWHGPYPSGEEVAILSHTWSSRGDYVITAKAKDTNDLVSPEGTLSVSMPKNKVINTPFLSFLENHPYIFPILRLLLGL